MDLFTKLFGDLLVFVYHCFDRIVIHGYLSSLSRPEQVVHFFRQVVGVPAVSKEVLSRRTADYQNWVEAFARNHGAQPGVGTVRANLPRVQGRRSDSPNHEPDRNASIAWAIRMPMLRMMNVPTRAEYIAGLPLSST